MIPGVDGSVEGARLQENEFHKPILLEETGPGAERSGFIGGSDVAAILGLSNWATPLTVWEKKTGRFFEPPDPKKMKLFERGKRWEQPAFEMLLDALRDRGHEVIEVNKNRRYQDGEFSFLRCEIDREVILDGEYCNVEIKTVHPFAAKEWGDSEDENGQITDQVPIYYATQAMFGLGVTGLGRCIVGCLIGADLCQPYFVDRDEESIAEIRAACVRFWFENIVADRAPDPINMGDIKRLMYSVNGRPAELDDEAFVAWQNLALVRSQIRSLEAQKEEFEFRVADCIRRFWGLEEVTVENDNAEVRYQGMKVGTWKKQTSHFVDSDLLRLKYPKIRDEVDKPVTFRVFRAKKS